MTSLPMAMLGLGGQEVTLIVIAIILLFGAKKIPELARGLGKSVGEFKKAKQEFDNELAEAAKLPAEPEKPGTVSVQDNTHKN
jgi:sec-independent protein translocase protein TatA